MVGMIGSALLVIFLATEGALPPSVTSSTVNQEGLTAPPAKDEGLTENQNQAPPAPKMEAETSSGAPETVDQSNVPATRSGSEEAASEDASGQAEAAPPAEEVAEEQPPAAPEREGETSPPTPEAVDQGDLPATGSGSEEAASEEVAERPPSPAATKGGGSLKKALVSATLAAGAGTAGYVLGSRHVRNHPPSVSNLTIAPKTAIANATLVRFAANVSDPDRKDELTYSWDFGDGTAANTLIAGHVYRRKGTFAGTITVTDGQASASISGQVLITTLTGIWLGTDLDETRTISLSLTQRGSALSGTMTREDASGLVFFGAVNAQHQVSLAIVIGGRTTLYTCHLDRRLNRCDGSSASPAGRFTLRRKNPL